MQALTVSQHKKEMWTHHKTPLAFMLSFVFGIVCCNVENMYWFQNWGTETAQDINRKELSNDKWLLLGYKILLKKHQGKETHSGMRNTSPKYKDLLMRQVTDLSVQVLATQKTSLTPQWDLIQKKLLHWPTDSSCAELIPKQAVLKSETHDGFDFFLSIFPYCISSSGWEENWTKTSSNSSKWDRCFTPFCRVPGMQFYFQIYMTLEQNLRCLVYREVECWFENRLNLVLEAEERRQFFISSIQGYTLMSIVGFYLYWLSCSSGPVLLQNAQNFTAGEWKKGNILYSIRTV